MTTDAGIGTACPTELHVGSSSTPTECTANRHGDAVAYDTYRCRCPSARLAHNQKRNRRHLRLALQGPALVPAVSSSRRLCALAAIGYSVTDLARELDASPSYIGQLQHAAPGRKVHRDTASRVRAVYNRLADHPGPSPRAIYYARRNQWLEPLWWDDDTIDDPLFIGRSTTSSPTASSVDPVVVERLLDGQPPLHVTRAERAEAVRLLDARGTTVTEISRRLHMSGSRVTQILGATVASAADTHANNDRQEASA